jgi:hypothetical protein
MRAQASPAPAPKAILLLLASLAWLGLSGAWFEAAAQGCSTCGKSPTLSESPGAIGGPLATLDPAATDLIVRYLSASRDTCGRKLDPRYRIDCLRAFYVSTANAIPATGAYAPVRAALFAAARKLDRIVEANLDPAAPTIRPRRADNGGHHMQPLRAVARANLRTANAEAAKVVKETEMLILRSADVPKQRTAHYQKIATALDQNLILLRSG